MPLANLTIGQLLRNTAERYPDRAAVEYKGQIITYSELDRLAERYALSLLEWGIQKGSHVGILCEAEPNTVILSYALARLGAVVVMLNTSLLQDELAARIQKADVRYLLIGDGYKELRYPVLCQGLYGRAPKLKRILYIGQAGCDCFPRLLRAAEDSDCSAVAIAEQNVTAEDTAYILFTSGTGSTPKAVMTSHYSRTNSGIQQAKDLGADCHDRFCVAMPLFHCFSLSVNLFAACAVGACLYLPDSRHTGDLLKAVSLGRCTVFSCVPALYRAILKKPNLQQWDLSTLRTGFIGGSSYPEELFAEIENRLGLTLLSSLGQTEATAGITTAYLSDSLQVRASTVGHFMDHVQGQIRDPVTRKPLPVGTPGEICVRGYVVMQGYYAQPEETAKVIDADGWLHTGDIGWLDPDGNIHLEGRLKELIIRGGENISPKEIEMVFFGDRHVLQCKAVGVPDAHYGEEVCLCVVSSVDDPCSETYIRQVLSQKLASFKMPRYILFLESLPVTSTGKVQLQKLKEIAREAVLK